MVWLIVFPLRFRHLARQRPIGIHVDMRYGLDV